MKTPYLKKRYKFLIGIFALIFIILFTAPRLTRWYLVKHCHELIGRNLEIKKIRVNYFTGTLRAYGIKLYESDSKTVFVSFNLLKVKLDYLPLLKNEIHVKSISLDDPFAEVLQNNNKFNFSDLTASDSAIVVKDTVPSKPTKYIINNIKINRGYVKYTDILLDHTIALNKLDLLIPGFTWNSDSTNLDINFRFVEGGGFYSNLEINQADSTYSVNLKLDSLNLGIIEPYVQSNMHISALHGYLTNDIKIRGNMRSIMQLTVSGINHIYDFSMTDALNRKVLSFKDLTVDIKNIQPDKNIVNLNSVTLDEPVILFEMIDSTNNWMTLMKQSGSVPGDSVSHKSDSTSSITGTYTYSKLQINGGKILFADKTLRYPFEYTLNNIKLESIPVAASKDRYSFNISSGLNGTGTVELKTTLSLTDFNNMDLALNIGQFRMKDVDAYFKHYFGFPVTGGIMNFKTDNKIRPESLISDNALYFRKFTLDKSLKTKVEYHVPLRLALGILSDKDGIVDLKAPVETKGKDVKVKYLGRIILKIIGNLFVKAAVSPFNLLSSSYKVDPATLQEIRLPFLETAPDEKNLKSIDIIADILSKKPALNLDVYYCADPAKVIDSLARIMTLQEYCRSNKISESAALSLADSTIIKYMRTRPAADVLKGDSNLTILCRNYIGRAKIEAILDSVKTLQINFITNYLSHDKEIPAERFKIIPVAPDTIKPSGNWPALKTYFTAGN